MNISSIAIVGDSLAGWTAAAILAKHFAQQIKICVLEIPVPDEASAESAMPSLREFHRLLNIKEREFFQTTDATFKLATHYRDWLRPGHNYWLGVSDCGMSLDGVEFQHYANLLHQCGDSTAYDAYSLTVQAACKRKFNPLSKSQQAAGFQLPYAMHVNTASYKHMLRGYAQALGVTAIGGELTQVEVDAQSGHIRCVHLHGVKLQADFFIDCTGATGKLIEKLSPSEFVQDGLGCNRRLSWIESSPTDIPNHTTLSAHEFGWQKTIPLRSSIHQHYFYSSEFLSDAQALDVVKQQTTANVQLANLRLGYRKNPWVKNCLALGEAANGSGQLGLSNLHLVHSGILRFIELFPSVESPAFAQEFNRLTALEYKRIAHFQNVPFALSQRTDSEFWRAAKKFSLSDELRHCIDLFKQRGKIATYEQETFSSQSWVAMFLANECWPQKYDPQINGIKLEQLQQHTMKMKTDIQKIVADMPSHPEYLQAYCSETLIKPA